MGGKQSKHKQQEQQMHQQQQQQQQQAQGSCHHDAASADYTEYDAKQHKAKFVLLNDPRADVNLLSIIFTNLGRLDFIRASRCSHGMRRIGNMRTSRHVRNDATFSDVFFAAAALTSSTTSSDGNYSLHTHPSTQLRIDASQCHEQGTIEQLVKNPLFTHIQSVQLQAHYSTVAGATDPNVGDRSRFVEEMIAKIVQFPHLDTLHLHLQYQRANTGIDAVKCLAGIAPQLRVLTLPGTSWSLQTVRMTCLIPLLANLRVLTLPTTAGLDEGVLLNLHQLQALCIRNIDSATIMSDIRQLTLEHALRSLSIRHCASELLFPLFQTREQAASGALYRMENDLEVQDLYEMDRPLDPQLFCPEQPPNLTNLHCSHQGLIHRFTNLRHLTLDSARTSISLTPYQQSHLLSLTFSFDMVRGAYRKFFSDFPQLPALHTLSVKLVLPGVVTSYDSDDTLHLTSMLQCLPSLTDLTLDMRTITRWHRLPQFCPHLKRLKLVVNDQFESFAHLCEVLGKLPEFVTFELVLSEKWRKWAYEEEKRKLLDALAMELGAPLKQQQVDDIEVPFKLAPFTLPPSFVPSACASSTWRTLHVSIEHLHPRAIARLGEGKQVHHASLVGELMWSPSTTEENIPPLNQILQMDEDRQQQAVRQMRRFRIYSYHPAPDGNNDMHDCYGLVPLLAPAVKNNLNKTAGAAPSSSSPPVASLDRVGWRQHAIIV